MKIINILLFFLLVLVSCREKYEFPLRDTDVSLLVVEGVLNAGQGRTNILLSRTLKVNDTSTFKPELNAKLTVEDKNGGSFTLSETGNGNYSNTQLPMVIGREYRLRIQTSDNKVYLSDYVVARQTPEIDFISWKKENENLIIYANTHDVSNNTRYYKWEFDETWEIRSYYSAFYKWTGGATIIPSSNAVNDQCWKYGKSNTIILGSTTHLQSDVVSEAPVQFIPSGSEKLSERYSILVKQQTLTKEAHEYFRMMKKNTESIGTIFDPQPSELKGNIHCITNPQEGVIGYLTASSFSEKRIFITTHEADWKFFQSCPSIEVPNHPDSIKLWVPGWLPYNAEIQIQLVSYHMAQAACVDCTLRGGNLNKPAYW